MKDISSSTGRSGRNARDPQRRGASGARLWEHRIAPGMDDYMDGVFEQVCWDFVRRRSSVLLIAPLRVGEGWDVASQNEIDVVAIGPQGQLLLGECKWGTTGTADLRRLYQRADLIARELSGIREVRFALFSARGLAPDVQADIDAGRALHFSADDLYAPSAT